ncbi:uncharacterized protein N7479_006437 [Penicillium vulpinum]|uniref:Myb-like DNA-binding domain-containing protein n=1 Tax=Penicillium vulpinum TaxID=29845 RepID=A0A1V6S219_9EURO|nr:uncharacterized protein N7479_006437 [Penicillium vulpinum]KAJ5959287.1 hypothetical protein N7479_006437 [Penicillium vulpinum]OQE08085.1 hypothetical protein PENVUL_c011G06238 [Penicillium vulpinum]
MTPVNAVVKSRAAPRASPRKRQAASSSFKDEEMMLLWKVFKLTDKEISIAALAQELNLTVGACRMRWLRLKAKLEGFDKTSGKETDANVAAATVTTATVATAAVAGPADPETTMEDIDDCKDTKEAEESEDAEAVKNEEDAE